MAMKLTTCGKDLLLRTIAGEAKINFQSIQFGNGANAGLDATALSNPLLETEISSYKIGDIFATLIFIFNNNSVASGFRATELGVFVDDPDNDGKTMMYAYKYTPEAEADQIPASSDKLLETQMDVLVYIGNAENVTASISQSLVYASKKEFDDFANRKDNPHQVTAKQVGLDNVPNVATNDQTPTYTAINSLTEMKSGEKLSVAFGKISRAVSSLIAHIGTVGKNVHKETPESIGAAKSSHKHSTTDITEGNLSVVRGGTGAGTFTAGGLLKGNGTNAVSALTGTGAVYATESGSPQFGTLPVVCGGTGVNNLVGTDYSTYRVRGISILNSAPTSLSNGQVALVYL